MRWDQVEVSMQRRMRLRHLSLQTERSYLGWLSRFRVFMAGKDPGLFGRADVEAFLSHLAMSGGVAASTQNQAFSALLFLFRHVLHREFGGVDALRARGRRLPVVLSRGEVQTVLERLPAPYDLMARVAYGSGLRLQECLDLRVKDVDFAAEVVMMREGRQGSSDRVARFLA